MTKKELMNTVESALKVRIAKEIDESNSVDTTFEILKKSINDISKGIEKVVNDQLRSEYNISKLHFLTDTSVTVIISGCNHVVSTATFGYKKGIETTLNNMDNIKKQIENGMNKESHNHMNGINELAEHFDFDPDDFEDDEEDEEYFGTEDDDFYDPEYDDDNDDSSDYHLGDGGIYKSLGDFLDSH